MDLANTIPPDMHLRRGTLADAAAIAEIAERLFVRTFEPDNEPANLTAHVRANFGEVIQREELADPAITYLLLEVGTQIVAFAELKAGSIDPSVRGEAPLEIQRFYVDQTYHGTGVASHLMDACMREAQAQGAGVVWLGVWERNPRAIRFYEKRGFVDVGGKTFQMGEELQFDRVMSRPVSKD
jgi:ribosomal protein S18 acetylase RimI-like enzyme